MMRWYVVLYLSIAVYTVKSINNYTEQKNALFKNVPDKPTIISIRKCHCRSGQYWDRGKCFERETFVPYVLFNPWTETLINSKKLDAFNVSKVQCNADQLLVPIKAGTFYVIGTGNLFHLYTGMIYSSDEYCVEHVVGRVGNIRLDALVCITRPNVHRCCPSDYIWDTNNFTCKYTNNSVFSPQIIKEPAILKWKNLEGSYIGFPLCHGSEIYNKVDLEDKNKAVLLYRSNGIFLQIKNYPTSTPYIIGPHDYCVTVEETSNGFQHYAFYCEDPLSIRTMATSGLREDGTSSQDIYLFPVIVMPFPIK